ncbi:MAG TPA: magnesium-translocating P-type ATPase [Candidatus Limnocylindria bacterium]|nr:magnesium-translocating P-type ATPase [Candidatus Limnocylindria bacterium]
MIDRTKAVWELGPAQALAALETTPDGLSRAEVRARRARIGPNRIGGRRRTAALALLARQFASPIVLILVVATVLSGLLGDVRDAAIILAIIAMSGLLGFWQERSATRVVEDLLAVVQVRAEVRRGGAVMEVPVEDLVPGDVVLLNAGDIVPADCLVLESQTLQVDQAALTGESYPVEKVAGAVPQDAGLPARSNALFLGTHVISGAGTALVVETGAATELGRLSSRVAAPSEPTGFERGMTAFGYLLVRVMVVLVVLIFVVNILLARPLVDSALFSLALAVGLTPQLLPAIVTISLSEGARLMARRRVIVKRLDAIEDFGGMTVLCTDKTGTMTTGSVALVAALAPDGAPSTEVRELALLNARLQTGFANPIDDAIVAACGPDTGIARCVDELPYDFTRRRLSVLVERDGERQLITKGALESVLACCDRVALADGRDAPLTEAAAEVRRRYEQLSREGYRVLGIATARLAAPLADERVTASAENGLVFRGLLLFQDPPKPGAAGAIGELAAAGISVRMISGDNRLVAAHVGSLVGLDPDALLTGTQMAALDDEALARRAAETAIFAEVDPLAKERIVRALSAGGEVVGYLGDGINDAPALHAADVGISVDTAVDVAKQSAAIVLLDKELGVLLQGIRLGRRTFANTMKYVFTNTSASFGNMLSLAIGAAVLPFLPLLADQVLLVNLLSDFPAMGIATDEVDPEQLERPQRWDLPFVRSFMLVFGGISSIFDLLTFAALLLLFSANATLFRSGWFIESIATELAVLFVLRTRRPFFRSRPSLLLIGLSAGCAVVAVALPYSPLAGLLGLDAPSLLALAVLLIITVLYAVATELTKRAFYRWQTRVAERQPPMPPRRRPGGLRLRTRASR